MENSGTGGAGDCDSDGGSISWEDFFGSSTDLVPTLLTMYDSLIAQSLSASDQLRRNTNPHQNQHRHHQDHHYDTSDQLRWVSLAVPTNSNSTSSTSGPSPLTLEKKHDLQQSTSTDNNPSSNDHRDLNKGKHSNTTTNNNSRTSLRNSNSTNSNSVVGGSRNPKLSSNSVSNKWSSNSKTKIMTMKSNSLEDSTRSSSSSSSSSRLLNLSVGGGSNGKESQNSRPLSVNSTVSSASSSSCSSDVSSSASLSNTQGLALLAPRASPEEEDVAPIPDADISEDDEESSNHNNYRCAKSSDQNQTNNVINGTERCFNNNSNSTAKDCAENGSRTNRISYPIPAQGRPRFCDPNLSYMDRVVMEIVETERMYVNDLQEIISGYLEHWQLEPDETLPVHDIQELFSNIEEIHQFNSQFLKLVEGCGLNPVQVARCFVTKNEGFSIYTQYCTNYPRTMSILTEMMRQELSAKSFRERQASLGHTLPLGSYLLKPVQRILKYHLLLQNIVKHYDHAADGYDAIVEALSAMTNIAHHINDMKRRHEHAVRVQEIQSLLYGWQGEDLTTYGELCAEGTFRVYGAKALRHVFLFDKMILITKKKDDGILSYKSHIMCSNLMLIESVPGEPLSFHVIPFDNPRFQCTLQARNLDQKREWTLQLKRVILENYHAVIPTHARQLVMELGQCRPEDEQVISEKAPTKRQHSAPEYLERRKQEKERRKSESTLKARLRRGKKGDPTSPKESPGAFRRSRRTSMDTTRDRSESRDREVAIDRKMSSASCPPCGTTEKRLVKKLSGWRRKSEPGFYLHPNLKLGKGNGLISTRNNDHGTSDLTLDSNESIGEEDVGELELESASQIDLCTEEEENELDDNNLEQLVPNVEERRESVEEIVGQLVMQNRDFQRILNKQRLVHLRKALAQHQQRQHLHAEEETASETETEEPLSIDINNCRGQKKLSEKQKGHSHGHGRMDSCGSQVSSSNGIGSSSDVNENSSENISIDSHHDHDELILTSKNVQRTVSDPGNKATLTPRRFISGPFGHYDPISLLWSSFRRNDRSSAGSNKQTNSPSKTKGKTNIRHTHSFTCSHKETVVNHSHPVEPKESLPLPHGDSGVFPNSFTSDSSSSSEANIPTLPAVWLKQQDEHLATPNNKSGSLPRSFQVCQHSTTSSNNNASSLLVPKIIPNNCILVDEKNHANHHHHHNHSGFGFKSRLRDGGKYADRPFTIASDKPSTSDISYDEMEQYMSKFNDQRAMERKSPSTLLTENDVDDLTTMTNEVTPVTSMENLSLHPDHKIYRSSKSSIKHMLMSVTYRLSGIKSNMIVGGNGHGSTTSNTNGHGNSNGTNSNRGHANVNFGSFPNIVTRGDSPGNNMAGLSSNKESPLPTRNGYGNNVVIGKNGSNLMSSRNYRKSLKQKIKHIVREDRDSDSENCESVTCSSGSSGFGSLGSCGSSSNNLTSKIGARLAQCCEHSDYALSKLLGSAAMLGSPCPDTMLRPQSVMSVSSTMTSTSSTSTDEKTSSGLGESLSSECNNDPASCNGESNANVNYGGSMGLGRDGNGKKLYRLNRKGINHRDLYLSYIDQEHDHDGEGLSDSDASADSFYERSFEAIENFLENEIFPDSAIYSDQDENGSVSSGMGSRLNNWSTLEDSINESLCSYHHLHSSDRHSGALPISMALSNGQSAGIALASSLAASLTHELALALPPPVPNKPPSESRRSRLVRSQVILEKLKHLEECSQFHREEPPSPSFEGIKSIQERRKELELWRGTTGNGPPGHCSNREDESETSSQHSTSTINTVIELSPSKSTSFPSSRRCSDTDSSGGNSPLTERAVSRSSSCQGHLVHNHHQNHSNGSNSSGDPMTKGWVKLVVGKLQGTENNSP